MAPVVFAFSSQPDLTERQALEVSDALRARRNFAAQSAARKIRDQARVNVDAGETRTAVALEPEEVAELAAVMTAVAWPDEPQYTRLLHQLRRASKEPNGAHPTPKGSKSSGPTTGSIFKASKKIVGKPQKGR